MPSQQRFEGPVLEDLLEDVRERFGPDVDIVEANKVRSGGIGGFFAREAFEVVVEVDDALTVPLADATSYAGARRRARETGEPAGGTTLLDLVDAVDDGPGPSMTAAPSTDTAARSLAEDVAAADDDAMASEETIRQLLRKTDDIAVVRDADPVPPVQGTTVSTDGDAFAAVLARIAQSTATTEDASTEPEEAFQSFADAARNARRPTPTPAETPTPAQAPAPAQASAVAPDPAPATTPAEAGARPDDGRVRGARQHPRSRVPAALDTDGLARLGLPATQLPTGLTAGADRITSLVQIAAAFPVAAPLPATGDAVIAIVGDRTGMEQTIAWIQEQLGLTPETLMLATRSTSGVFPEHRRITDHEVAATRRSEWRRGLQPVLVAVDAPVSLSGTAWAKQVLDALAPGAVWGVVDATRKPEDVVEWSERIGGVDALSLHGTADTSSPAAVLTTGLPVSLVDGAPATPARWAAMLDDRLAA